MGKNNNKGVVLLVDSDRFVLDAASMLLGIHGYRVIMCETAPEASALLASGEVDAVLSDIRLLRKPGPGILEAVRSNGARPPLLVLSGHEDVDSAIDALQNGAYDLIIKPYRPEHLLVKIERAIEYANLRRVENIYRETLEDTVRRATGELVRANGELRESSMEMICRLAGAAEFRDSAPLLHASRVGLFAGRVAESLGLGAEFVEDITFAAPLHDIGMAGVPGHLLHKSGSLAPSDFETVKTHTMEGHRLLDGSSHRKIKMAAAVALTHHERWDGSGYPRGMKGDEIPLEGMITMICDRYDALRGQRPYRPALGHNESITIIIEGNGRSRPGHFHPLVMDAFKQLAPEFDRIFAANREVRDSFAATKLARIS